MKAFIVERGARADGVKNRRQQEQTEILSGMKKKGKAFMSEAMMLYVRGLLQPSEA